MKDYNWVCDASMGWPPCFCPVEQDEHGEILSIITGVNFVGSLPQGAKVIAVVHEGGGDAAEAFMEKHGEELKQFFTRQTP